MRLWNKTTLIKVLVAHLHETYVKVSVVNTLTTHRCGLGVIPSFVVTRSDMSFPWVLQFLSAVRPQKDLVLYQQERFFLTCISIVVKSISLTFLNFSEGIIWLFILSRGTFLVWMIKTVHKMVLVILFQLRVKHWSWPRQGESERWFPGNHTVCGRISQTCQ